MKRKLFACLATLMALFGPGSLGLTAAAAPSPAPALTVTVPSTDVKVPKIPIHLFPLPNVIQPPIGKADTRAGQPPLVYHGGYVIPDSKTYAVFWDGGNTSAFSSTYKSLITRWLTDA